MPKSTEVSLETNKYEKTLRGAYLFLGVYFTFEPVVNFVHPYSTLGDLTQIIICTIVISGWLIIYDLKRKS